MRRDVMTPDERTWYRLKYGQKPPMRVVKKVDDTGKTEYIVTNKLYDDINWSTTNET